jgi:hypothetical protein
MIINVPDIAIEHFWEDTPPEATHEFWALRFQPKCKKGDKITFKYQGKPVAEAVVDGIESPGQSQCMTSGKFKNRWKVFWRIDSFKKMI